MKILKWVVITQWSVSVLAIIIRAFALIVLLAMLTVTPAKAGYNWSLTGATPEWGPVYAQPANNVATGGMWNWLFRGFTFAQ